MIDYPYFNPFRKQHVELLKFLEKELVNDVDIIDMCKFGDRTQHIFKNGNYLMTVNWGLV